ncbi:class B sortase [Oscillospiraceae bacterium LTW-04]|nr:class B sortase [Oscillospiraceae bacterium MB24-C1]
MKILLSILAAALVFVAGFGGYYVYRQASDTALTLPWQDDAPANNSPSAGSSSKGGITMGTIQKPGSTFAVPDSLAAAVKANRDTVAWLEVPGAEVNDSVLQYLDNLYYERRDERKNYNIYGCYFMDYECPISTREVLAPNTVIYGHSAPNDNPDGKRFSKLFRYTDPEVAAANPCITLTTEDERMLWQIFAVFYTDVSFDYIQVHISGDQMKEIADHAKALSIYDYGIDITPEDKILTLSTCSDRDGNDGTHRFVIMARLMPEASLELERATIVEKTK